MTPIELLSLATEIRKINLANGFDILVESDWADKPDKVLSKLALIHSEISEYWEEEDKDKALEELADVQIRGLDLIGAAPKLDFVNAFKGFQITDYARGVIGGWCRADFINDMHGHVSRALEIYRDGGQPAWSADFLDHFARLIRVIDYKCGEKGLAETIQAKLAKNRARDIPTGGTAPKDQETKKGAS